MNRIHLKHAVLSPVIESNIWISNDKLYHCTYIIPLSAWMSTSVEDISSRRSSDH